VSYSELRELVKFRPLERPIECAHLRSPFSRGWSSTVALLARELRLHGALNTIIELDFREQDFRVDGLPRGDRTARSPGIVLSFKALSVVGHPELRYEAGSYHHWQDNVLACARSLESLRAVDRYGVTKRGEQYAGWKALPAGSVGEGNPVRGRELIAQSEGNIKTALFLAHPDHGGEPDDFRDIIAARDAG
jgi:hypothetical protein